MPLPPAYNSWPREVRTKLRDYLLAGHSYRATTKYAETLGVTATKSSLQRWHAAGFPDPKVEPAAPV